MLTSQCIPGRAENNSKDTAASTKYSNLWRFTLTEYAQTISNVYNCIQALKWKTDSGLLLLGRERYSIRKLLRYVRPGRRGYSAPLYLATLSLYKATDSLK